MRFRPLVQGVARKKEEAEIMEQDSDKVAQSAGRGEEAKAPGAAPQQAQDSEGTAVADGGHAPAVVSSQGELPADFSEELIGTHDGNFHEDEVFACILLMQLPKYSKATIVRTRKPELLAKCGIVVDVGSEYDHMKCRYDHHQREFKDVMHELGHSTKLSSAGLVYRHYGRDVLQLLVEELVSCRRERPMELPTPDIEVLYRKIYEGFVERIDGTDNGIEAFQGGTRNYGISTTLSGRVASLNPRWNEASGPSEANVRFISAMQLVRSEFLNYVEECVNSWWPARSIVEAAFDNAAAIDPSQQIIKLGQTCPWQAHIFPI